MFMTKQNTAFVLKPLVNIQALRFIVIVATVLPGQVGWELRCQWAGSTGTR